MPKRPTIKKKSSVQTIFSRFLLIVAFFVIWIGVIGVRLVHLQVTQHEWLRDKALDQRRDEKKSKILRGSILDSSGRALALSVDAKSLYADPTEIDDVPATAQRIATILKIKPSEILADLQTAKEKGKRFVWLARKLDEDVAQKLNVALKDDTLKKVDEPKFKGLHWREEQKRSYPYGALAAQVIGFSDANDEGKAGIELSQEQNLKGGIVENWRDHDRLGRIYDQSDATREQPKDIVLTISNSMQYKVEQALKKGVEAARAKSGVAIVLDPKTGEILAMANYPTFDPNKLNDALPETFGNKAVQNMYSPGSVFKLVTYGAALNEKLIQPDGKIDCGNGIIKLPGREIVDKHCHSMISYGDALAISSNYAAIKTGQSVGKEKFYNYVHQFGFGETSGIELPAESRGILRALDKWNADSLSSMSIGYEIGVTALQSAIAFATIANDGVRVKPHIIKEIRAGDSKEVIATETEKVQVVSPEAARGLRQMLQKVVLSGTGKRAQLNGYSSAGKTGTAWKYDAKLKKINEDKYVSSFIGFAPFDKPSVVIAVVLDEPQVSLRDGGYVSAPIFRDIAEQILPELNIAPDGTLRDTTADNLVPESEAKPNSKSAINSDSKTEKSEKKDGKVSQNIETKMTKNGKVEVSDEKKQVSKPKAVSENLKPKNETKNKSSTEKGKSKT